MGKKVYLLFISILFILGCGDTSHSPSKDVQFNNLCKIGIVVGFDSNAKTTLSKLNCENDFVDIILTKGKVDLVKEINKHSVMYINLNLDQMRQTVSLVKENNLPCNYIGYNPERGGQTPLEELDDFIETLKIAQSYANECNAQLIVGPGYQYMSEQEQLYQDAAKLVDGWIIQAQVFQIDKETKERTSPEEFRNQVIRIINLLKKDNPNINIFVQISVTPGREGHLNPFSAEEIVDLINSIEDLVDGVRIYHRDDINKPHTLYKVISILRNS